MDTNAIIMPKDHGNHIFFENLDKSLYFVVGFKCNFSIEKKLIVI